MTAHVLSFPADDAIFARLTEQQRLANLAEERAEAVETARYIIDHPHGYSDDQLRTACGFYMTHGNGGVHYLRATEARLGKSNPVDRVATPSTEGKDLSRWAGGRGGTCGTR